MLLPPTVRRSTLLLLALAAAACSRSSRPRGPQTGTQLERSAELPAVPSSAGAPDAAFSRACAGRLRDPKTGREYLLLHSEIERRVTESDTLVSSALARAVGDYGPVPAEGSTAQASAQLRVDCRTSRVLSVLR